MCQQNYLDLQTPYFCMVGSLPVVENPIMRNLKFDKSLARFSTRLNSAYADRDMVRVALWQMLIVRLCNKETLRRQNEIWQMYQRDAA